MHGYGVAAHGIGILRLIGGAAVRVREGCWWLLTLGMCVLLGRIGEDAKRFSALTRWEWEWAILSLKEGRNGACACVEMGCCVVVWGKCGCGVM